MSTHTALTVPTRFVEADGIRFAYRRWGKPGGFPIAGARAVGIAGGRLLELVPDWEFRVPGGCQS